MRLKLWMVGFSLIAAVVTAGFMGLPAFTYTVQANINEHDCTVSVKGGEMQGRFPENLVLTNPEEVKVTCQKKPVMSGDVIIHNDFGGVVEDYIAKEAQFHGRRVIIDGPCESACTIFLHNPKTCATPRAYFGFHRAWDAYPGKSDWNKVEPNDTITVYVMALYPARIRRWIEANRPFGLDDDTLILDGDAMFKLVPRCQ